MFFWRGGGATNWCVCRKRAGNKWGKLKITHKYTELINGYSDGVLMEYMSIHPQEPIVHLWETASTSHETPSKN